MEPLLNNLIDLTNSLDSVEFGILFTISLVGSIAGFIAGFSFLRSGRIMQDTPTSKIRSASQGFVEIEGKAKSIDGALKSPGTSTMCAWFDFEVEEYRKRGNNSGWQSVSREVSPYSFYVDDGTGVCAIDPSEAQVRSKQKKVWKQGNYRYTEKRIDEGEYIYCLGQFETEQGPSRAKVLKEGARMLLNQWKQDRKALLARFDANGDGEIDMEEWAKARQAAKAQTQKEIDEDYEPTSHHVLIKPFNRSHPYLISAYSEEELNARYTWYTIGGIASFIILGITTVLLAITRANFIL